MEMIRPAGGSLNSMVSTTAQQLEKWAQSDGTRASPGG
tara:strand:- start:785 stop:898 length:114 start_codon:yes stop_codon:yes gene_type:complete